MNRRAFIKSLGALPIMGGLYRQGPVAYSPPQCFDGEAVGTGAFGRAKVFAFWRQMYSLAFLAKDDEVIHVNPVGMGLLWDDWALKQGLPINDSFRKAAYYYFSGVQVWNELPDSSQPVAKIGESPLRAYDVMFNKQGKRFPIASGKIKEQA